MLISRLDSSRFRRLTMDPAPGVLSTPPQPLQQGTLNIGIDNSGTPSNLEFY